ncbi:MAG TPA: hypothetical protein VGW78_05030 [Candidatus Babeliales bacterium]|jgi:hypothetical protein|nr:hypothetical protein [Candidatus Babeliales bacterium]
MQEDIASEAERIYASTGPKISMKINQGICNNKDCCHYYLLQHKGLKGNKKRYNLISAHFKPDQRLEPYLQLLNTQQKKLEAEKKYMGSSLLYPDALCIYHLYTNDFDITASTIQHKMGPLYDFISDELKALLPKPSIVHKAWHYLYLKHVYRNYIKYNLGYVTWAAMAGTLGYFVSKLSPQNRLNIGVPLGLMFMYGSVYPPPR